MNAVIVSIAFLLLLVSCDGKNDKKPDVPAAAADSTKTAPPGSIKQDQPEKPDEVKELKINSEKESSYWGTSVNRGSIFSVKVEGGVPPYKYSIALKDGVNSKSVIDQNGQVSVTEDAEIFYVSVLDATGKRVVSNPFDVNSNQKWVRDERWANEGALWENGSFFRKLKLSSDQKSFFALKSRFVNSYSGPQIEIAKYSVKDGSIDKEYGQDGRVLINHEKGKIFPHDFVVLNDDTIFVNAMHTSDRIYSYGDDFGYEALIRINSNGEYDSKYGIKNISVLLKLDNVNHVEFERPIAVLGGNKFIVKFDDSLVAIKSDGTLDQAFGVQGRAHVSKNMDLSNFFITSKEIIVVGDYSKVKGQNFDPKLLGLTSFDLSGKPTKRFDLNTGIATYDLEHRPRVGTPYVSTSSVHVDEKENIRVSGLVWDTPFYATFSSNGKLLASEVLVREIRSRPFEKFEIFPLKNSFLFILGGLYEEASPIWHLAPAPTSYNKEGMEQTRPELKMGTFRGEYAKDPYIYPNEPWYRFNNSTILALPDGSIILNTRFGLVRMLP